MGKPWDDLSSAERLDAILLALHAIGAEGASAASIAHTVAREHVMRYPRFSHNGKAMSTATRVTPGIIALRNRGLIGFTRRPGGRSGTADALTHEGYVRVRAAQQLAGCTKDEYRVLLDCLRQIPMPEAERREARPYVSGGPKRGGRTG
jgi:hypothetical protein